MKPQQQAELVEKYKRELFGMLTDPDASLKLPTLTWMVEHAAEQLALRDAQISRLENRLSDANWEKHPDRMGS